MSEFNYTFSESEEKKLREIEDLIKEATEENSKLKVQNQGLINSVNSIKKEVQNSFEQMKSLLDGYKKK